MTKERQEHPGSPVRPDIHAAVCMQLDRAQEELEALRQEKQVLQAEIDAMKDNDMSEDAVEWRKRLERKCDELKEQLRVSRDQCCYMEPGETCIHGALP